MRFPSKTLLIILLFSALVPVQLFVHCTTCRSTERPVLQSASELSYPPFAIVDSDGNADGFSVELLKSVVDIMGQEINIKVGPWHEIKQELIEDRLDVLPLVSYSVERDRVLDFTAPYLYMHGTIFIRKDEKSIHNREDLRGKELLVMNGDTAYEWARHEDLGAQLILTETYAEAFTKLAQGHHDAIAVQHLVGLELMKRLNITNIVALEDVRGEIIARPNEKPVFGFQQKFCFAVTEGNSGLLAQLNEGMAIVVANGTYDRLYEKWFGPILPPPQITPVLLLKKTAPFLIPTLLLLALGAVLSMRREVRRRTIDLRREISERKRVERALRENEERLQLAMEGADLGLWDWDIQSGETHFSSRYFSMLGYKDDELPHAVDTFEKLLHPDDAKQVMKTIFSSLHAKQPQWSIEFRLKAADEKFLWILGSGKVVECAEDGTPIRATGTHQNISRRKAAEKLLQDNEKRYRELFNNMSSCVAIYESVSNGKDFNLKDINQAGLEICRLEYDKVIGSGVRQIFPAIEKMGLFTVFQRVWRSGKPEKFPCSFYQDERISLWVENYVYRLPSGELVAIYDDVTTRKKAEDDVVHAKEQWEATFDSIPDLITIQDMEMRIIRANKATIECMALQESDVIGRKCYEVIRGDSKACPDCPETKTIADKTGHIEIIEHKNLEKIFLVTSSPILNRNNEPEYIVHVAKDITQQKKLEEELSQAQKMEAIGTLAGGIAHDFNNILSAIIGYSELAKDEFRNGGYPEQDIDQVLAAAQRASELVKQILTFSRKSKHQLRPLSPHIFIKESLKMLRSSLPSTITIEEDIDTASGTILADPTQLHQILANLCTNSLHAMQDEKGTLNVSLCRREVRADEIPSANGALPGSFTVLSVSDTGCGMDNETMERIFDPYFTTKEVGKGTGLGLAVINGIVKDYKGFIEVESKPAQGTTFRVHIPALKEEIHAQDEKTETAEPLPTGNERILVVDDENLIAGIHKQVLERLGYSVMMTTDSQDALDKVRRNPNRFDLIITDQTMPKLSGIELAREILHIQPAMPIILCTGFSSVVNKKEALAVGIKKFLHKPVSRKKIARTVRAILDGRP
ncbi:MAG: transporter substrate-binding domain-containing protein [Desulfobulbaceae bacterium]|nr:transporter substrate-binding domain-containing protein [Desulfobulbaceae bacterium]